MLPETINEAYVEAVKALGGSKVVGHMLWPAKGVEAAQRHLLACLNPDRNERLAPDECLLIESMARDKGCYVVHQFRSAYLHFAPPQPIEPEDESDQLRRELLAMGKELQAKFDRLNAAEARTRLKAA